MCLLLQFKIRLFIILDMDVDTEQQQLIQEINQMVFPKYCPGCSPQDFLASHELLFEALRRFDSNTDLNTLKSLPLNSLKGVESIIKIHERMTMMIIELLNKSCSNCHRKQYSQHIFELLKNFKGNLKNLAIGKAPIKISQWDKLLELGNAYTLYYSIKDQQILAIYDELYMDFEKIPHRQTLLLNYPTLMIAKHKFEGILKNGQKKIPQEHQYYLAVIAAATYGSKYLWNRSVNGFIKHGGNIQWIINGIVSVPPVLQELSKYSAHLAYNFKQLYEQPLFNGSVSENQYKLEGLILLSYFQGLACLDLICGFIPQNSEYEKYLPNLSNIKPTLESFQTIKRTEGINSINQLKLAEEFANLFSWDKNSSEQELQQLEGMDEANLISICKRKRQQSLPDIKIQSIYLLGKAEQDQIYEKVGNLQSLKHLQVVFEMYVNFQPLAHNYTKKKQKIKEFHSFQDEFILASDWDYQIKALNRIERTLGAKFRQNLHSLITSLRVHQNQHSKQMKYYYQFFNNYMYEYISYPNLIKQITINEKNYLKLITKSPFLFTEQTFGKMKKDLALLELDTIDFVLESISYKLELNITLISQILDKQSQEYQ